jgi:hypothetical protein
MIHQLHKSDPRETAGRPRSAVSSASGISAIPEGLPLTWHCGMITIGRLGQTHNVGARNGSGDDYHVLDVTPIAVAG